MIEDPHEAHAISWEKEQIQNFRIKFLGKSSSWIETSIRRLGDVSRETQNMWSVRGKRELDDYQRVFLVIFDPQEQRYRCTCFTSRFGYVREKEICTHIGSVILWRMINKSSDEHEANVREIERPILLYGGWIALREAFAIAVPPVLLICNMNIPASDGRIMVHFEPNLHSFDIGKLKEMVRNGKIGTIIHYFNPSVANNASELLRRQVSKLYGFASANRMKLIFVTTASSRMQEGEWRDVPSNYEAYEDLMPETRYVRHRAPNSAQGDWEK